MELVLAMLFNGLSKVVYFMLFRMVLISSLSWNRGSDKTTTLESFFFKLIMLPRNVKSLNAFISAGLLIVSSRCSKRRADPIPNVVPSSIAMIIFIIRAGFLCLASVVLCRMAGSTNYIFERPTDSAMPI